MNDLEKKLDRLLEIAEESLPATWARLLPEEGFAWISTPLPHNNEARQQMMQLLLRILVQNDRFVIQFMTSDGNIHGQRELRRAQ